MALPSAFAQLIPGASVTRAPHAGRGPPGSPGDVDGKHLARALREAHRGVGRTAPNPPVGAVVARGRDVLGVGFHPRAGERHGEIVALDDALARGARVQGATLYVTLEPCVHFGRTPPCTRRVIAEGIARVVIGALDPSARVHEKGVAELRAAGIAVEVAAGPLADECAALVAPFAACTATGGRAYTVLKIASSLDGRVGPGFITGEPARALVHRLRDAVDAVIVGAGTVLADNPALTVRAVEGRDPQRIVVDRRLRTAPRARVFAGLTPPAPADRPAALVVHAGAAADRLRAFDEAGVARLALPGADGRVDLPALLRALPARGVLAALVEAGPGLATALLRAGLVDELWWLTAPRLVGADGVPAGGVGQTLEVLHRAIIGDDALVVARIP